MQDATLATIRPMTPGGNRSGGNEEFPILVVFRALSNRKRLLGGCLAATLSLALFIHFKYPKYVVNSALFVRRPENSLIQTFSGLGPQAGMGGGGAASLAGGGG